MSMYLFKYIEINKKYLHEIRNKTESLACF